MAKLSNKNPLLQNLSPEEAKILQAILDEIAVGGKSFTLEQLKRVGFKEQPADLKTFLTDERYLGIYSDYGNEIYEEWWEQLKEIFSGRGATRCKYSEIYVTGATRIGKTTLACYGIAYMLHILICMDKPQRRYKISSFSVITFLFFNVTKDMAEGVAFRQFNDMLITSPWFNKKGKFTKSEANPKYIPNNRAIRLRTGSAAVGGRHALGMQVFCALCDEMNFGTEGNRDVRTEKTKMSDAFDTINTRIRGTIRYNGIVEGCIWAISSKNNADMDFMEAKMEEAIKNEKDYAKIIDKAQWEVIPWDKWDTSGNKATCTVAVGDLSRKGFVVPKELDTPEYRNQLEFVEGYRLVYPPEALRIEFESNYEQTLMDVAGIAVQGEYAYYSMELLETCWHTQRGNPFPEDVVEMGITSQGEIIDYFNWRGIPREIRDCPMFIHLDAAIKGDKKGKGGDRFGIAGIVIAGEREVQNVEGDWYNETLYEEVFAVDIAAPKKDRIDFEKIRKFIYALRDGGFHIEEISADNAHLSEDMRQTLMKNGFKVTYRSVDRTIDGHKIFKGLLADRRILLLSSILLKRELQGLRTVSGGRKVDHGHGSSKDIADAVVGATWGAVLSELSGISIGADEMIETLQMDVADYHTVNFEHNPQAWGTPETMEEMADSFFGYDDFLINESGLDCIIGALDEDQFDRDPRNDVWRNMGVTVGSDDTFVM